MFMLEQNHFVKSKSMLCMKKLLSKAWQKRMLFSLLAFLWIVSFQIMFSVLLNSSAYLYKKGKEKIVHNVASFSPNNKGMLPVVTINYHVRQSYQQELNEKRHHKNMLRSSNSSRAIVQNSIFDRLDEAVTVIDSRQNGNVELNKGTKLVFYIPHAVNDRNLSVFSQINQHAVRRIAEFLKFNSYYDAATCSVEREKESFTPQVNDTWCRFSRKDSTMIIRNTGPWLKNNSIAKCAYQSCNLVRGPFLMRKDVFLELGWNTKYGKASTYDFFLRSEGKLKIARLSCCVYSRELFATDRGTKEGTVDFPDYSHLANDHGILRIVMEDRVEWTKCVADSTYCKEVPFVSPKTLPQVGMPLCCCHVLDRMLKDIVWAIDKIGMSYRIIYGTLLGSIRNKAIIPWTHDIDVALNRSVLKKTDWGKDLREVLQGRYYVGDFAGQGRAISHIPAYINVNTTPFFQDSDDLTGDKFFSEDILMTIQNSHKIGNSWRERGYMDFYEAPEIWWNGSSVITINGEKYTSIRDIDYELANWYGKNYMSPVLSGSWQGLSDTGS